MLGDCMVVAVKSLKDGNVLGEEIQSQSEVKVISLAVHCNLLRLYGFCITQIEKLLVYPYMSNASVESRIKAKPFLVWALERYWYVLQEGLCISMSTVIIINHNVKATNMWFMTIDYGKPMVGDFTLAKLLDHQDSHITKARWVTLLLNIYQLINPLRKPMFSCLGFFFLSLNGRKSSLVWWSV